MTYFWDIVAAIFIVIGIYTNTTMLNDLTDKNASMFGRCFIAFIGTVGYISLMFWLLLIILYFSGGITVK